MAPVAWSRAEVEVGGRDPGITKEIEAIKPQVDHSMALQNSETPLTPFEIIRPSGHSSPLPFHLEQFHDAV